MAQAQKTSNGSATEQSLAEQVAILKTDFKDFAATLENMIGERKADLAEMSVRKADKARKLANTAATAVGENAVQVRDTTIDQIRQRPLTALAVSVGIGVLAGLLTSRRY